MERVGSRRSFRHARAGTLTPEEAIDQIYTQFAQDRQREKVSAWMGLQQALARHASILCPTATSLKDLNSTLADIEIMLKGQQGEAGKSPAEYLEQWLTVGVKQ